MKRRNVLTAGLAAMMPVARSAVSSSPVDGKTPESSLDPIPAGEAQAYVLHPIGRVEIKGGRATVRVFDECADGLLGLDQWSHVIVLYWFDKNDSPEKRGILRVHPRGNPENPLTGVFACRSPVRPNLIAFSVCRIEAIEGAIMRIDGIDAFDGTPVLDLKPFTPGDAPSGDVRVPSWARR